MTDTMIERAALKRVLARVAPQDDADREAVKVLQERHDGLQECEAYDALPITHKLVGKRYMRPHEVECNDLDEAIETAVWAVEGNWFGPERVIDLAGNVVLEWLELEKAMQAYREDRKDG